LVVFLMIDLLRLASGWGDVGLVIGAAMIVLLPVYLIARPPNFGDDGDDDESGGGGTGLPPTQPDSPAPHDGLPDLDWTSFDDLRREWDREPAET
jgi:hypothetical protein